MTNLHDIISEVEEYSKISGLSEATICGRAANNARLLDRIRKRAEKSDGDILKLKEFMKSNPINASSAEVS